MNNVSAGGWHQEELPLQDTNQCHEGKEQIKSVIAVWRHENIYILFKWRERKKTNKKHAKSHTWWELLKSLNRLYPAYLMITHNVHLCSFYSLHTESKAVHKPWLSFHGNTWGFDHCLEKSVFLKSFYFHIHFIILLFRTIHLFFLCSYFNWVRFILSCLRCSSANFNVYFGTW